MTAAPPRCRALLLVATPGDACGPELERALHDEAGRAAARAEGAGLAATARVAVCVGPSGGDPPSAYDGVLERGLANGVALGGLAAVVEIESAEPGSLGALAPCFEGAGARLGPLVDHARSTVVVGTDVVIVDGDGEFQLFYCMRRAPGSSHDAFSTFWREQHTKVAQWTPGLTGYRQLHADLAQSRSAAAAAGLRWIEIDGVALEWFPTLDDFASAVGAPAEFTDRAKSSEEQFNDLSAAIAVVTADRTR